MRRSAWIPVLATLIVASVTARLGFWQLDRADQKEVLQAQYERMRDAQPLDLTRARADIATDRYRRAQVTGTFEPQHEVLLDNQVEAGAAGYHVLTPLRIVGRTERLIVNRGWIGRTREYPSPPQVNIESQSITLTGILVPSDRALIELSNATIQGKVWQNFTAERFRTQTGLNILPYMLVQQDPPTHNLKRVKMEPDFGIARHYGYAVQWFGLAVTVITFYVAHTIRRKRQAQKS